MGSCIPLEEQHSFSSQVEHWIFDNPYTGLVLVLQSDSSVFLQQSLLAACMHWEGPWGERSILVHGKHGDRLRRSAVLRHVEVDPWAYWLSGTLVDTELRLVLSSLPQVVPQL